MGGVSLLFKLKLNEFHFYKQYCQSSIWIYRVSIHIKSYNLSGSRVVSEAFLKSLSTDQHCKTAFCYPNAFYYLLTKCVAIATHFVTR